MPVTIPLISQSGATSTVTLPDLPVTLGAVIVTTGTEARPSASVVLLGRHPRRAGILMPILTGAGTRIKVLIGAGLTAAIVVLVATGAIISAPPAQPASCPVSQANVPGGPDGSGGCWPGPGNTGPAAVPTQTYPAPTGSRYVITQDTTIDGYNINGGFLIQSGTLTIKNSIVTGTVEVQSPGAIDVENSKVLGGDWVGATFDGPNITINHSDISGTPTVVNCSGNCTMTETYSHDPWFFTNMDAHSSAFATNGGTGMTVRHNTVWCNIQVSPTGGGCTGDLALQTDFADAKNITIDHNLFPVSPSGSYCITGGYWPTKAFTHPSGIVITNNIFGKGSNGFCGVFGTSDAFSTTAPGNQWTNNKYTDGTTVPPNV